MHAFLVPAGMRRFVRVPETRTCIFCALQWRGASDSHPGTDAGARTGTGTDTDTDTGTGTGTGTGTDTGTGTGTGRINALKKGTVPFFKRLMLRTPHMAPLRTSTSTQESGSRCAAQRVGGRLAVYRRKDAAERVPLASTCVACRSPVIQLSLRELFEPARILEPLLTKC